MTDASRGLAMITQGSRFAIIAALALTMLPAAVHAQSTITGVVTDPSMGALPGVVVEATSPVLIEKVRSAVTDGAGVYRLENLPPGTYTVTYMLQGFSVTRREGLAIPSNFTATVNVELRLGALEESITVTGESPVVDTQSTSKSSVVDRELLDLLPTGRTAQTAGALIHTTVMGSPDVGGTGAMSQNHQTTAGMSEGDLTVTLDGIQLQGFCGNGSSQAYHSPINYEEIVFEAASAGADQSAGGIRQHLIPRRGGNEFSGTFAGQFMHRSWQGSPLTPELVARGLTQGPSLDGLNNAEGGMGGPMMRDKLWFFASARRMVADRVIPNAFYRDGSPGVADDKVTNRSLRLTWQANTRNQFTAYYDWVIKTQLLGVAANTDIETVARPSLSTPYAQGQVKWTAPVNSKLMIEVGGTDYRAYRQTSYAPGVYKEPFTPEWYAGANRNDTATGRQTTASAAGHYIIEPVRRFVHATATYVTGSHSVKFGMQNNWGKFLEGTVLNADLNQRYQNGVPFQVQIFNSPVRARIEMNRNLGLFVQDSWRIDRLTLLGGLRWEDYQASVGAQETGNGRFVPARRYEGESLPAWRGIVPRMGATFDVFGDAKTALKFSVNKFQAAATGGLAIDLNPVRLQSVNVQWRDLNGDDIAQGELGCAFGSPGCEINFAQMPANFGITVPGCSIIYTPTSIPCGTDQVSPDVQRETSWHYNVSVQHELLPRVSVSGGFVRANFYDLRANRNILQSFADYTPVDIVSPMDGSVVRMFNVSPAKLSQVRNVLSPRPDRSRWNNSFDVGFNARLPRGIRVFGGALVHRTLQVFCDIPDNPNLLLYCDQSQNGIPWLNQFKAAGTVPLPAGVTFSATLQSYVRYLSAGGTVWQITPATRYAAGCLGPCRPGELVNPGMTLSSMNVPLEAPSTRLSDRINQVDLSFGKSFRLARLRLRPEAAIFNALNSLAVYGVRSLNYGTAAYLDPSTILQPRLLRLGMQVDW
jgi:hypothetical protein